MYKTRSKNEYFAYLDNPYKLALRQIEFASNSIITKANTTNYTLANNGWQIPSTGLSLLVDPNVSIPNNYHLEVGFRLAALTNTVIAANWDTNKALCYYIWYDSAASNLKLTYLSGVNILSLTIGNYTAAVDNFVALYATESSSVIYLNGINIAATNFVLPKLFNLEFSFNKSVNAVNISNSSLILKSFWLQEALTQPANYTPALIELQDFDFQTTLEKSKYRVGVSSSVFLPSAKLGSAFAPAVVNIIAPVNISTGVFTLQSVVSIPILPAVNIITGSITSTSTAIVGNVFSADIVTASITASSAASVQTPVTFTSDVSTSVITYSSVATVSTGIVSNIELGSITTAASVLILSPVAVTVDITLSATTVSANLTVQSPIAVTANYTLGQTTISSNVLVESSLNSDATLFLNALSGTYSSSEQLVVSAMYNALNTAGLYSKLDRLYLYFIGKNFSDMRRCLITRVVSPSVNSTPHWPTSQVHFNGGGFIDTGFIPNGSGTSYQRNSSSMGANVTKQDTTSNETCIMGTIGIDFANDSISYIVDRTNYESNINGGAGNVAVAPSTGYAISNRSTSTDVQVYSGNASAVRTDLSSVAVNTATRSIYVGALNLGASTSLFYGGSIDTVFIGSSFTSAEYTTLRNIINTCKADLEALGTSYTYTNKTFVSNGDNNDVFYHVGTGNLTTTVFKNPSPEYGVTLSASSINNVIRPLTQLIARNSSGFQFFTNDVPNSWIVFDLGDRYQLEVNRYSIKGEVEFNQYNMRSWILQGSNDSTNWVALDTRTNETAVNGPAFTSWDVAASTYHRYFRILQTAVNQGGNHWLTMDELRLYGSLGFKTRT